MTFLIGRREWCALPAFDLPYLKAKVDTGARTSALHATDITPFMRDGHEWVRFAVHPLRKSPEVVRWCEARVLRKKRVRSSNARTEERYMIATRLILGDRQADIELSLTCRRAMIYRMLLGRQALIACGAVVDPAQRVVLGMIKKATISAAYAPSLGR
jgi:ribosomal protein S6--L-glutamate ligase